MQNSKVISSTKKSRVTYFQKGSEEYVRKEVLGFFAKPLCSHEVRVLNRLKGLEGVQQIVEQDTPNSFVSVYIPGDCLLYAKHLALDYFDKLKIILEEVHARGVADIDFAHSTDLLVTPEGNPKIIDLTASIIYDEHSTFGKSIRPLFEYICRTNHRYIVNRKARFQPEQLTSEEFRTFNDIGVIPKFLRNIRKGFKRRTKLPNLSL